MIAAWMLYCVAIALALTVVGVALERGLHLAGRPTRLAWLTALVGSFVIPAAAWLRPEAFSTLAVPFPTVPVSEAASVVAPEGPDAQTMPIAATPAFSLRDLDAALGWGWAAASMLLLCGLGAAALRLAALRRRWRASVVDGRRVLVSDNVGPAVTGLWRPVVIVPGWALALDQAQRRLMLSHEEEHLRAADPWLLALGAVALVLMPWNPALWWQVRRLRLAVEIDCDTRVLAGGGTTPEYGELLLQVGHRRTQVALAAPALGEPVSFLERRIHRMATTLPRWRWVGAAVALTVAAGALVGACEAPRPVSPDPEALKTLEARLDSATPGLLARLDSTNPALLARLKSASPAMLARLDSVLVAASRVDSGIARRWTLDLGSRQAAAAVRQHFPDLLQGRDEPVYIWLALGADGRVVAKGTTPRAMSNKAISTGWGARIMPGYDTLIERHAREYGVIGFGALVRNSPPVLWVRLADGGTAAPQDTGRTYLESTLDQRPERLDGPAPQIPNLLRHAGIEGRVIVRAIVGPDGRVEQRSLRILESPHPALGQAAKDYVLRSLFRPGRVNGRSVRVLMELPVDFKKGE